MKRRTIVEFLLYLGWFTLLVVVASCVSTWLLGTSVKPIPNHQASKLHNDLTPSITNASEPSLNTNNSNASSSTSSPATILSAGTTTSSTHSKTFTPPSLAYTSISSQTFSSQAIVAQSVERIFASHQWLTQVWKPLDNNHSHHLLTFTFVASSARVFLTHIPTLKMYDVTIVDMSSSTNKQTAEDPNKNQAKEQVTEQTKTSSQPDQKSTSNTAPTTKLNPSGPISATDVTALSPYVCGPESLAVGIKHFRYAQAKESDLVWSGFGNAKDARFLIHRKVKDALWELVTAARVDGVNLVPASIFRSVARQQGIIDRKRQEQQPRYQIFYYSSEPRYSEHHTGFALDFFPIGLKFSDTPQYAWLKKNAKKYGWHQTFSGAYIKKSGVSRETWHWRYEGKRGEFKYLFAESDAGVCQNKSLQPTTQASNSQRDLPSSHHNLKRHHHSLLNPLNSSNSAKSSSTSKFSSTSDTHPSK